MLVTLLAFVVTLGVLITFHELGHYWVARWCGVRVLRFSVGFGRVLIKRVDRHGTEWALSAIPLGGYVKMLDEAHLAQGSSAADTTRKQSPESFAAQQQELKGDVLLKSGDEVKAKAAYLAALAAAEAGKNPLLQVKLNELAHVAG